MNQLRKRCLPRLARAHCENCKDYNSIRVYLRALPAPQAPTNETERTGTPTKAERRLDLCAQIKCSPREIAK